MVILLNLKHIEHHDNQGNEILTAMFELKSSLGTHPSRSLVTSILNNFDDVLDRPELISSMFSLLLPTTSVHAGLLSLPASISKADQIKLLNNGERDHQCCTFQRSRRKRTTSLHWNITSFSQLHRIVMMVRISVWTAVPPKIIPAQIPWS